MQEFGLPSAICWKGLFPVKILVPHGQGLFVGCWLAMSLPVLVVLGVHSLLCPFKGADLWSCLGFHLFIFCFSQISQQLMLGCQLKTCLSFWYSAFQVMGLQTLSYHAQLGVLGVEPRALWMLGRHFTYWATYPAFCVGEVEARGSQV